MSEIDVSKCEYLEHLGFCLASYEENELGGSWEACKDRPNCYYKQLQQANGKTKMELLAKVDTLEKEKEFWCNKSVRFEEFVDKLVEEKDKLKAENEELKKNVEHWKMEHKEAIAKGEWTYDLVKKRLGRQLQQLKESNKTLNEMFLILNNRLEEYKRIYGEL